MFVNTSIHSSCVVYLSNIPTIFWCCMTVGLLLKDFPSGIYKQELYNMMDYGSVYNIVQDTPEYSINCYKRSLEMFSNQMKI